MAEVLINGQTEILKAAKKISSQGEALTADVQQINNRITSLENDPSTFPLDEYSKPFLKTVYHKSIPTGPDASGPANAAIQGMGVKIGELETQLGQAAADQVVTLTAYDEELGAWLRRQPHDESDA